MANNYLQPNESIILKQTGVRQGQSGNFTDELQLTNLNFIWIKKGFFGGVSDIQVVALNKIRITDDRVNALLREVDDDTYALEVYLTDGAIYQFAFNSDDSKKEIMKWIQQLQTQLVGMAWEDYDAYHLPDEVESGSFGTDLLGGIARSVIPGAGMAMDISSAFKKSLGKDKKRKKQEALLSQPKKERMVANCPNCGAPTSGWSTKTTICPYCDSVIQL